MTITAANLSKTGYIDGSEITLKRKPFEKRGNYPIHEPTYTGNIDYMMVLDKDHIVISYNPIPELHNYMITNVSGYSDNFTTWENSVFNDNPNYTVGYQLEDDINDNIVAARKDMDELLMEATSYYAISSSDDTNYSTPQAPTSVNKLLQDYHLTSTKEGLYPKTHTGEVDCWIPNYRIYMYLEMPTSMVDGDTYTVTLDNGATVTFLFDRMYTISRSIKVNQIGYLPSSTYKYAYLGGYLYGDGPLDLSHATSFEVIDASDGSVALSGTPRLVEEDPGYDDTIGTHTGTSSSTELTDSTKSFTVDALIGNKIYNMTDGSSAVITDNTATTVTVSALTGGVNNTFENGDQYSINTDTSTSMYGEDVYRLDISSLSSTGTFFISVPGVGRSWPFKHSSNAYSQAAYINVRGLYHHRAGQHIKAPYTKWPRQMARTGPEYYHCEGIQGPQHGWSTGVYNKSAEWPGSKDIFDEIGGSLDRSNPITQAPGGHHDAADWDSGFYHLVNAMDLMYAFQFNSSNFSDNQWNIDESGDGVPDVLSEAIHSLEVWRLGQDGVSGGVPCILQTWTHPTIYQSNDLIKTGTHDAATSSTVLTDSTAYFTDECVGKTLTNSTDGSTGTVTSTTATTLTCSGGLSGGTGNNWESGDTYSITVSDKADYCYSPAHAHMSAQYAAAAAMLARLLTPYDSTTATTYLNSAIAAYDFAKDAGNFYSGTTHACNDRGSGAAYTFDWNEGQADVDPYLMMAKCQLYLATGTTTYITEAPTIPTIQARFTKDPMSWTWTVFDISSYVYYSLIEAYNAGYTGLSSEASTWETWFTNRADAFYEHLWEQSYPNTRYVDGYGRERMDYSLGSGFSTMTNYNRILELAYQINGTQKYRDAQALNLDFMYGCNPMGESWTTGIGYVYPICILNEHTRITPHQDPVPGITPYGISGGPKYFTIQEEIWTTRLTNTGASAMVSSLTPTGGTATMVTSEAHGLVTGDTIYISDATPAGYEGKHTITVSDTTTFTFPVDSGLSTPASSVSVYKNWLQDEAQRTAPKWRTYSNTTASVGQTEYTIHENISGQMFATLIFLENETIEDLEPREGTDLHGQWMLM